MDDTRPAGERFFRVLKRKDAETGEIKFYAQTHCNRCGSTMSSGEWWASMARAVDEAREGMIDHETRCVGAGGNNATRKV